MTKTKTGRFRQIPVAVLCCAVLLLSACSGTPFSSEDWRQADMTERQGMVRSLMREYDLVGWTEADVIRLLGPETSSDPDFAWSLRYDTDDTLVYALGASDYAKIEALVVTLDGSRTVTKWELVRWDM